MLFGLLLLLLLLELICVCVRLALCSAATDARAAASDDGARSLAALPLLVFIDIFALMMRTALPVLLWRLDHHRSDVLLFLQARAPAERRNAITVACNVVWGSRT